MPPWKLKEEGGGGGSAAKGDGGGGHIGSTGLEAAGGRDGDGQTEQYSRTRSLVANNRLDGHGSGAAAEGAVPSAPQEFKAENAALKLELATLQNRLRTLESLNGQAHGHAPGGGYGPAVHDNAYGGADGGALLSHDRALSGGIVDTHQVDKHKWQNTQYQESGGLTASAGVSESQDDQSGSFRQRSNSTGSIREYVENNGHCSAIPRQISFSAHLPRLFPHLSPPSTPPILKYGKGMGLPMIAPPSEDDHVTPSGRYVDDGAGQSGRSTMSFGTRMGWSPWE